MTLRAEKASITEGWLAGGLVALAAAITYGILIPQLGFYRDDWYMLWAGQSLGLSGIIQLFQTDRPLIGWAYALDFKLIGANVLYWQIYGLVLKIITGLAALWLLRLVWPEKRLETTFAALLFVLYPGFYQQPVAGTFKTALMGLGAVLISMALTIYALKTPNRWLQALATVVALVLGLINVALYEAMIGLEVVRWALVWYVLQQRAPVALKESVLRALKYCLTYFLMIAGFVFWRVFIFKSVRRATSIDVLLADYLSNPLYGLSQLLLQYVKDLFETIVGAWFIPFYQFTAEGRYTDFFSALGVTLVVLALVGIYFVWFRRHYPELDGSEPVARHFLLLGLIGVILPSAIIVLLGRNVVFSTQWDRYTLQSMLGVALVVLGFILYYLRGSMRWIVLFGLLFLAVMTHYHSAAYYSRFWNYERNLVWQLSWRAPAFQPDTVLIVSFPEGYRLAEEYEVWGPVNMAYYPGQEMQVSGQIPYDGMLLELLAGTKEHRLNRNINVKRDYTKPLMISMPSQNSCFHIIDGQHLALPYFENPRLKDVAAFSRIDLIDPQAASVTPSAAIFGAEPEHGWCYYYQKMSLALQAGDWQAAARLADEAAQKGLRPADETEWVTVVQAYAGVSDAGKAESAAKEIDTGIRKSVCLQQAPDAFWPQGFNASLLRTVLCGGK